jgi:hypothetical protein
MRVVGETLEIQTPAVFHEFGAVARAIFAAPVNAD